MTGVFDRKITIVTGGGRGIGAAVCQSFASEGAIVAVFDQNADEARSCAQDIAARGGVARAYGVDVTDRPALETAISAVAAAFGGIDILVNNAGIGRVSALANMPVEDWDRVIDVNLTGPFNCTRAALPYMKNREGASIVVVSSLAAKAISYHGGIGYTAAKSGLLGFVRHAAYELSLYGIRINSVLPGPVLTPMVLESTSAEERRATAAKIPLGRWVMPEDIANAVLFFAGPLSSMCTGTELSIDGGMLVAPNASREEYFTRRGIEINE